MFTAKQVAYLLQQKVASSTTSSDAKEKANVNEQTNFFNRLNLTTSNDDSMYPKCHVENSHLLRPKSKITKPKNNMVPKAVEALGEAIDKYGKKIPIQILFDTGTTSSIVLKEYIYKNIDPIGKQPAVT